MEPNLAACSAREHQGGGSKHRQSLHSTLYACSQSWLLTFSQPSIEPTDSAPFRTRVARFTEARARSNPRREHLPSFRIHGSIVRRRSTRRNRFPTRASLTERIVKIRSSANVESLHSRRESVRTLNADFFAGADALVRRASTVVLIFCAFCVVLDATRTPVKLEVSMVISFVCRNDAEISRAVGFVNNSCSCNESS
jgi:hypothetical protein